MQGKSTRPAREAELDERELRGLERDHPGETSVPIFGSQGAEKTHCKKRGREENGSATSLARGEKTRERKGSLVDEMVPMK